MDFLLLDFLLQKKLGRWGAVPISTYVFGCNWVAPPKKEHHLRMFPLKMTSWSTTSMSSPRSGLNLCHGVADCVDKPPANILAEVYTWIWRFDKAVSLWWKIVCSHIFVHIYFIDTSSIVVKQKRITESLYHKGAFQERIRLFKNEAHDVCRYVCWWVILAMLQLGDVLEYLTNCEWWRWRWMVCRHDWWKNQDVLCTKWAPKPVRAVGLYPL